MLWSGRRACTGTSAVKGKEFQTSSLPSAGGSARRGKQTVVSEVVLDASALLAYLFDEPGADMVSEALLAGDVMSTVNLSEVLTSWWITVLQ